MFSVFILRLLVVIYLFFFVVVDFALGYLYWHEDKHQRGFTAGLQETKLMKLSLGIFRVHGVLRALTINCQNKERFTLLGMIVYMEMKAKELSLRYPFHLTQLSVVLLLFEVTWKNKFWTDQSLFPIRWNGERCFCCKTLVYSRFLYEDKTSQL